MNSKRERFPVLYSYKNVNSNLSVQLLLTSILYMEVSHAGSLCLISDVLILRGNTDTHILIRTANPALFISEAGTTVCVHTSLPTKELLVSALDYSYSQVSR